jgi:hypothetical protein
MNATSTFATPRSPGPVFSTHTARQQAVWNSGNHAVTGTTTERAALFGPFRLLRRNSSCRKVKIPSGRQSGPGNPTLGKRIPPVPDLALPLHSTGAKP